MVQKTFTEIPVTGPLDTANPMTNRAPGTWVKQIDGGMLWTGPRRGHQAQTQFGRIPPAQRIFATAAPDFSLDGTNSRVKGELQREQADLSNRWTADLAFHAFATRAVATGCPIFQWRLDSTNTAIVIGLYGTGHANASKLYAIVKTTSAAGTVDSTTTLVGGTVLFGSNSTFTSGGKIVRCFVRLIRNGANLTMLDSMGTISSVSNLTPGSAHVGATTERGAWLYGDDANLGANALFQGVVLRSMLRDVVEAADVLPPAMEHVFPRSKSVRFFGTSNLLTNLHVADQSSYGAHGLVTSGGAGATTGDRHHPFAKTVQGMGSFTDRNGAVMSAVMIGGLLSYQRVR